MKDMIDRFTWAAIGQHADGASDEHYRRLREKRRLYVTRCPACDHRAYPPRPFCPSCFANHVDWEPAPEEGTLYAFTTQSMAFRFMAPDVVGLVELEGIGRILTKINAPLEELEIGQRVRFEAFDVSDEIVVHSFTPVASK